MYDKNVGKRIKEIANIFCWLGIVLSVMFSLFFNDYNTILMLVIAAIGCFFSWAGFMCLYGFGELIEQTKMNRETNEQILVILKAKYTHEEKQRNAVSYQASSNSEYTNTVESSEE